MRNDRPTDDKLKSMTVEELCVKTASAAPAPGGGSVASAVGALAAALSGMVISLTVDKAGFEEVRSEMLALGHQTEAIRRKLLQLADRDMESFNLFMAAMGLPKSTPEEKAVRAMSMQAALKAAAEVPLHAAREMFAIFDIAAAVVERGNKNAVTDGLISAVLARAAMRSALYNVKINLRSIRDEEWVYVIGDEVRRLEEDAAKREAEILALAPEMA